jgi:hypothetical protein
MATPSLEPQQYRDQQLRLEPPASRRTASGVGDQGDVATRLGVTVEDQCHEEKHVPSARPAIPTPVTGLEMRPSHAPQASQEPNAHRTSWLSASAVGGSDETLATRRESGSGVTRHVGGLQAALLLSRM